VHARHGHDFVDDYVGRDADRLGHADPVTGAGDHSTLWGNVAADRDPIGDGGSE
jgi:hypothetical protein